MAPSKLEERVAILEAEVNRLKSAFAGPATIIKPGWRGICGAFAGDPAFVEAMRLGSEYRESLRPKPSRR
jgi:hypothetical protein